MPANLLPDVSAICRPGADAPFAKRREFVMVMAELLAPENILPLIGKLAAEQPNDPQMAALQLVVTLRDNILRSAAIALIDDPAASRQAFALLHFGRTSLKVDDSDLTKVAVRSLRVILRNEDRICTEDSWESPGASSALRPGDLSTHAVELPCDFVGDTPYDWLLERAALTKTFHQPVEFLACFGERNRGLLQRQLDFFIKPTAAQATALLPDRIDPEESVAAENLVLATVLCNLCGIDPAPGFAALLVAADHPTAGGDDVLPLLGETAARIVQVLALQANTQLAAGNLAALADTVHLAHQRFTALDRSPDQEADPRDTYLDRHSQPNCRGTLIPVGDSLKSDFFCSHHNEKISENFC